jgi:outer membrane protein assembly factor BamE (lipoprotein component of BamABCDE complex)
MVTPGMTKRQVYALLPPPHFGEGLFGVREWNYVLNFYTGTNGEYVRCQYQIRYDRHARVSGTWFRDQVCADWLNYLLGTPETNAPTPIATTVTEQR